MPSAVADVVVVGVGDPVNGTFLNGRNSKQDVSTLKQIAVRLKGTYHNGNDKHLPSELLLRLTASAEGQQQSAWTLREAALATLLGATLTLAIIPLLLHYFASPWLPGIRRPSPAIEYGQSPKLSAK
jgi:Ca-activated chloride channel family protein